VYIRPVPEARATDAGLLPTDGNMSTNGPMRVLLVGDEAARSQGLAQALRQAGLAIDTAAGVRDALVLLHEGIAWEAVITSAKLPDGTAADILDWAEELAPTLRVIVYTGAAEVLREIGGGDGLDASLPELART